MDSASNLIVDQKQSRHPPFKRIFIVLVSLLLLYFLIWLLSFLLEPQSPVKNLLISNLTDHQVTLSWVTEKSVKGTVAVSKDKLPLMPFLAKRIYGNEARSTAHHVTVSDLNPNTKYNFKIFEGIKGVYQVKVTTPSPVSTFLVPHPVYGRVLTKDKKPVTGALIYLTALPNRSLKASDLIMGIAKQDGYATTISTLEYGAWKTYVVRGDKQYSGDNFPIEVGKAYFVKAAKKSTFVFQGQELVAPIKLSMKSGWNAIGLPKTTKSYSIGGLMDALNTQKAEAQTAARYESGNWDAFVKIPEEFGNNFPIENKRGYVIRIDKDIEFTP